MIRIGLVFGGLFGLAAMVATQGCRKLNELQQQAELQPLEQGFKSSAAIGFCAAVAVSAFNGETLPANVSFSPSNQDGYTSSGLIHITVDPSAPLPFNRSMGDIFIAGLWDGDSGVISIVFGDFDVFTSTFKFYGLYTIPISRLPSGTINTVFAQQDIIIGEGSDTLLSLSLSKPKFNAEVARLNGGYSSDPFVAVKQNVWFVSIDPKQTPTNWYDDVLTVNGGGQLAEIASNSGGILYHALIDTRFSYDGCSLNPVSGTAFVQNVKASGSLVDLGNLTLTFHGACDGKANVLVATGKYITSNGKSISLGWN